MSLADASNPNTDAHADDHHTEIKTPAWLYVVLALVVVLWGTSVALFGVPGLYMPAVAAVPVIFLTLVLISRG
jgi:hypothetical protein